MTSERGDFDPNEPIGVALNDAPAGERVEIQLNDNGVALMENFRMPRPPWVEREHDWLAPFSEIGKALLPIGGTPGIQTWPPTAGSWEAAAAKAPTLTFYDLLRTIREVAERVPVPRQRFHCGDDQVFRDWAARQMPLVKDERMNRVNRVWGIDVVMDPDLPPNMLELREGDRVLRRMVLPTEEPS